MTTTEKLYGREVTLHPVVEGQIHSLSAHKAWENHVPGMCYDCNCPPEYVVEENDGEKWLWCGNCDIGG